MGLAPELHAAGYAVQELRLVDRDSRKVGGFSAESFRRNLDGRFTSAAWYSGPNPDLRPTSATAWPPSKPRAIGRATKLVYLAYTTPGRMVARFAMRDDKTLFLFVFTADQTRGPDPQDSPEVKTTLSQVFGNAGWECPEILRELDGSSEVYFDRVSQIVMDHWSQGRAGLIGDAAAAVSLLAGEGTGLAMVQAYVLAGELSRAGADHPEAFRRYERRLRPIVEARQRSARAFASMFAPKTSLGLWTRNAASRLLDIPRVADWVIGREFRDDIALPEYVAQR